MEEGHQLFTEGNIHASTQNEGIERNDGVDRQEFEEEGPVVSTLSCMTLPNGYLIGDSSENGDEGRSGENVVYGWNERLYIITRLV